MHKKNEVIDLENYRAGETDASFDAPQHLPAGTTLLLGQYKITGYLNCGGFGITYRAHDSLNRPVVIKECFPGEMAFRDGKLMGARTPKFKVELDAIVEHFVKEAHRLANAKHDNVVHVHQVFEENDTAYMAMDYIDGPDLLDILNDEPDRFTPRDIERLVRKMLHAIKYIHGRGMLHRDISPDNILIDPTGEPILIDFGSAREYASQATRTFSKLKFVKDGYSPQEFYIAGSEQSTASDLYSFAASIYHLITGFAPEVSQKRLAALAAKKPDPYVPLAGNVTGFSMRFLKSLDKALRILPEQRIQTADEWLKLLTVKKKKGAVQTAPQTASVPATAALAPANKAAAVSGVFAQLFGNKQAAASVGIVAALLGAVALFAVQSRGPSDDVTLASSPAPSPVLVEDPRFAVVDPTAGGLPGREPLSMDTVTSEIAAVRAPTPPDVFALPLLQAKPSIGAPPEMNIPDVALDQPPLPSGLLPVERIEAVVPLSIAELAEAPVVALPDTNSLVVEDAQAGTPLVPTDIGVQPSLLAAATLADPNVGALPVETELLLPDALSQTDLQVEANGFAPSPVADAGSVTFADTSNVTRPDVVAALPNAESGAAFAADVAPPPPTERLGPVAAVQVAYSHWDVRMPFTAELSRVRNANTAEITSVTETADLSVSGDWIAEGVILYSFNGERLEENTPISVHVLKSLNVDPDGYARATVRYRDPSKGILDRGLLAVPVVREIGMADGTIIQARMIELSWILEVTAIGEATNGLQVGDILRAETQSGVAFSAPEDLSKALDALVAQNIETADMTVLRDGTRQQAVWHLARKRPNTNN